MDADNCLIHIETEDIFIDIAKNVETRPDISNYELE